MISQFYSIVLKINVLYTFTLKHICRQKLNDKTNEAKGKQLVILEKKSIVKFPVLFLKVSSNYK